MRKRSDGLIERIRRALHGASDPVHALAHELAPTDLQSLMLHVYRERTAGRTPSQLLLQYENTARVQVSTVDARALASLEQAAFEAAVVFEAVELPPIAPLGINAVLGQIDQNNCLATVRGAEVLADPTSLMALECARRRRTNRTQEHRLCARSRLLRLQPFEGPGYFPHFGIFSMVTAGRDSGDLGFELSQLREHLTVYLRLLEQLSTLGFPISDIDVAVSDTERDERRLAAAGTEVLEPLGAEFPRAAFRLDRSREQGRSYYRGLCLGIDADIGTGRRVNLCDGGGTDWTQRLLSDAKERLITSAIGLERIANLSR